MSSIFGNDGSGGGSGGPSDYDVAQDIIIQAVEDSVPSVVNLNPILARLDNLDLADVRIDLDVLGLETSKLSIVDHDAYKSGIVVDQNVQNSRLLGLENEQITQNGLIAANTSLANSKVSTTIFNSQVSALNGFDSSLESQITTEKNKNDVQDTRLSSVESINAIQSTAITNLQTSLGSININGKLDTALYNVDQTARVNIQTTNNNRLTSLEAADIATASTITGVNISLNNLVIADNLIDSRLDVLEARTWPLSASDISTTPITGVSGVNVQANLSSLKTLLDGVSTGSSGFNTQITDFINGMNTRFAADLLIYERVTNSPRFWYFLSFLNQSLATTSIAQFGELRCVLPPFTVFNDNQLRITGNVNGFNYISSHATDGGIHSQFKLTTDPTLSTNYKLNGTELLFKNNNAIIGIVNGVTYNVNNLINQHSALWSSKPDQSLNMNSYVNFGSINIIDSTLNTNSRLFNVRNNLNDDFLEIYKNNVFILRSSSGASLIQTYSSSDQILFNGDNRFQGPVTILNNVFNLNNVNGLQFKSLGDFSTERAFLTMTNPTQNLSAAYLNTGRIFMYNNPFNTSAVSTEINSGSIILRSLTATLENKFVADNNGSLQLFGDTRVNINLPSFSVDPSGNVLCNSLTATTPFNIPYQQNGSSNVNVNTSFPPSSISNCIRTMNVGNNVITNGNNTSILGNNNTFFADPITVPFLENASNNIVIGKNNNSNYSRAGVVIGEDNIINYQNSPFTKNITIGDGNILADRPITCIGHLNSINSSNVNTNFVILGSNWNQASQFTDINGGSPDGSVILLGDPSARSCVVIPNMEIAGVGSLAVRISTIKRANTTINQLVYETSSKRFKENIKNVSYNVDDFMKIKPKQYNRIGDSEDIIEHGFIAEELNEIYPQFVAKNPDNECVGINYDRMVVLLLDILQKQQRQIDYLVALFKSE